MLTMIQSGKLWFGYVCGLAILGAISLNFVFSMMSPALTREEVNQAQQDAHGGYGSQVFASLIGVVLPLDSLFGYCLVSLAIAWCTYSSSGMFCSVGRMTEMRGLVAYPLALFYVGFGIMAIFSSRGSGRLEAMKAGA
jgi:hypothetical protein